MSARSKEELLCPLLDEDEPAGVHRAILIRAPGGGSVSDFPGALKSYRGIRPPQVVKVIEHVEQIEQPRPHWESEQPRPHWESEQPRSPWESIPGRVRGGQHRGDRMQETQGAERGEYHIHEGGGEDMIGGCACSWGFYSWSTPPGGDQQKSRRRRAMCISAGIVGVIFSILAIICYFSGPFDIIRRSSDTILNTVSLSIRQTISLRVYGREGFEKTPPKHLLEIVLGRNVPQHVPYSVQYGTDGTSFSIDFEHFASLSVEQTTTATAAEPATVTEDTSQYINCYNISWVNTGAPGCTFEDALVLEDAHWYGGALIHEHKWPMEKWDQSSKAFITGDSNDGSYGGVQARYWLSSNGVAIHVDWDVPLFLAVNHNQDGLMRLTSKCEYPYTHHWQSKPAFRYSFCHDIDGNMRRAHDYAAAKFIPKPGHASHSDDPFMQSIWSTRARYKKELDHDNIVDFAQEIHDHGFTPAQFEIDDGWTRHYGDFDFDASKFPDPEALVRELNALDFQVTLWTHPFASPLSKAFYSGNNENFWVRNWLLDLPAIVVWSDGLGALLDVTNPRAVDWYLHKHLKLKDKYGIHSFKFNNGEGTLLPTWHRTHHNIHNPNNYTKLYAQMARRFDKWGSQAVGAGSNTQELSLFTRMTEKYSNWGYDNGLKTLIPQVLTYGIIHYPYILPDIIGGNVYSSKMTSTSTSGSYPERELYIRWLQVCTFFPLMHFSVPPWYYDDQVTEIAQKMYDLHKKFSKLIVYLANNAARSGAPIVRPLWWICPKDPECQTTDSQYLLGDQILVAPILEKGARSRDIYIPRGVWFDQLHGGVVKGPLWLRNYPAELDELPYFMTEYMMEEMSRGFSDVRYYW